MHLIGMTFRGIRRHSVWVNGGVLLFNTACGLICAAIHDQESGRRRRIVISAVRVGDTDEMIVADKESGS